ncbi:hypothetical protein H4K35_06905 [Myroides sp. NP-2]|uniref:hypothetical protein n=1 Tax=Myroides sp. NP-2 TaxID=2759945 RepID=UPI0015FC217F|nr:hypothetical protein [Myroides sp. NP-2]MBB1149864.1 hypothetical protein [Myroides sp. NP-2]
MEKYTHKVTSSNIKRANEKLATNGVREETLNNFSGKLQVKIYVSGVVKTREITKENISNAYKLALL